MFVYLFYIADTYLFVTSSHILEPLLCYLVTSFALLPHGLDSKKLIENHVENLYVETASVLSMCGIRGAVDLLRNPHRLIGKEPLRLRSPTFYM